MKLPLLLMLLLYPCPLSAVASDLTSQTWRDWLTVKVTRLEQYGMCILSYSCNKTQELEDSYVYMTDLLNVTGIAPPLSQFRSKFCSE